MNPIFMTLVVLGSALILSLAVGAAFAWFGLKGLVRIFFVPPARYSNDFRP
jgi:hypothetical protein